MWPTTAGKRRGNRGSNRAVIQITLGRAICNRRSFLPRFGRYPDSNFRLRAGVRQLRQPMIEDVPPTTADVMANFNHISIVTYKLHNRNFSSKAFVTNLVRLQCQQKRHWEAPAKKGVTD